jgi:RNA polymerase sigma-70 factor (ECF subfamily)
MSVGLLSAGAVLARLADRDPRDDGQAKMVGVLSWGSIMAEASDANALEQSFYVELRAIAEREFRRQPGHHTLQPTALIAEAWLRLRECTGIGSRVHALGVASKAMRHVLVDHARRKAAAKRGGDLDRVTLRSRDGEDAAPQVDLLDLEDALTRLAGQEPRQAQVVELKFFGGCTIPEIAEALDVSHMTVSNDWRKARVWLARELGDDG